MADSVAKYITLIKLPRYSEPCFYCSNTKGGSGWTLFLAPVYFTALCENCYELASLSPLTFRFSWTRFAEIGAYTMRRLENNDIKHEVLEWPTV